MLPSDKLSLDSCSDNHPFLHREELKMEADLLIKEYLNILSSPDSRIGPLTAIVGGMVGLCIMRPQLQILIGKPLLEITQSPPQGLGNMERESFIRCIRNFFISVYRCVTLFSADVALSNFSRVSTSSPTSKIFKEAAIALGSKPVDLLKFQKSGKHVLTPTKQAYVTEQAHVAEHAQESTPIEDLLKRIDVNSIPLNQLVDMIIFALGSTPDNKWDLALKVLPNLNIGHDVIGGLNAPPSGQDVMNAATASTVAPCGDVADSTHAPGLLVPNQGAPSMEKDAAQVNDADVTLARIMESQEINGESLFLDILKNIINSEKHFSSGSASILLRDLDSQLGGETDKRMSLSALKIGWYLIISKLSVAPLLSLSRRKVANSDSVMSYKLKTYEILVSFFLRDINSRFALINNAAN